MHDRRRLSATNIANWLFRSLAIRLLILVAVFLTVPVLIYQQFQAADQEKQALLMQNARQQGQLIAENLRPLLEKAGTSIPPDLTTALARQVSRETRAKVLLRPNGGANINGFYYVAATPVVPRAFLERERERLMAQGILGRVAQTCSGNVPLSLRVPTQGGGQEVLTSITSINTEQGCWAVVTSHVSEAYLGSSIGQPYWKTAEVRGAALVYLGMAALVMAIVLGIWRNLRRFGRLAQTIDFRNSDSASFAEQNSVPELHNVAVDFDRLVTTLRNSAETIRRAAEDNAHAFKTPIGVIRQSVEPLKRIVNDDPRGARAIDIIDQSLSKLDDLVSLAQHMDTTTADLTEPPPGTTDLGVLLERILGGYAPIYAERGLQFRVHHDRQVKVNANEDLLETVVENLIDNAVSFSPPGTEIEIGARRTGKMAELTVIDQGPGVKPEDLTRIFERYYSDRPKNGEANGADGSGPHFGIGLWIARQNVEAVGGKIEASNRTKGGLCMRVSVPLAG